MSAAVGCGALLIGMATAEPAQAAGPRAAVPQPAATPSVLPAQLPAWYHTPLTPAQIRSEVAIPRRPARVKGNVRLTKADYTNAHGALAVDATQAAGHVLIAGESLQLSGAGLFGYGSSTLTSGARAELARLRDAFTYVTSVECEGYTDYAATGKAADVTLGAARANAVCLALMGDDQGLSSTSATGLGEARPAVVGGQRHAQRAANRRVVVDITSSTVGAPKTPTVTVSSAFNQAAVLDLVPAASKLAVTGYAYSLDGGQAWKALATTGTSPVTGTIRGLTNGTTYHVLVRDLTAAGISLPTSALTVKPVAKVVPDAPTITAGTWTYQQNTFDYLVTLSWTEASAGSSPVTAWPWSGNDSAYTTMTGVTETAGVYTGTFDAGPFVCGGENDAFTLEAVSAAGTSAPSSPYPIDLGVDRPSVRHPDC